MTDPEILDNLKRLHGSTMKAAQISEAPLGTAVNIGPRPHYGAKCISTLRAEDHRACNDANCQCGCHKETEEMRRRDRESGVRCPSTPCPADLDRFRALFDSVGVKYEPGPCPHRPTGTTLSLACGDLLFDFDENGKFVAYMIEG